MKKTRWTVVAGVTGLACMAPTLMAGDAHGGRATGLVREVRLVTAGFHDVTAANLAGYSSAGSCVNGPDEGAMGIHYPNGDLIGDGTLDAAHPEILIFEERGGRLRLLGVEYLVLYDAWHATNAGPPVLMGQHFNHAGSPNRYGLPAYYQLHVWAWRHNPRGMFANWNPNVSCEEYSGE
jgi:hypothetical protein